MLLNSYNVNKNGVQLSTSNFKCGDYASAYCTFNNTCSSFAGFDDLLIQVKFQDFNYVDVPLATFAEDKDGECRIYIQNMDNQPPGFVKNEMLKYGYPVYLGTMWLQQFTAYFHTGNDTSTIFLRVNPDSAMNLTQITNYVYDAYGNEQNNAFKQQADNPIALQFDIDQESMTATVQTKIGYQSFSNETRWANFTVDLAGSNTYVYAQNCSTCESEGGVPYFNYTNYLVGDTTTVGVPQEGLNGYQY